ncbi:MAG: N-acetylmuramoyl-L-alanine amidase [Solirubrobacteraceae bacterium]|jgi:N-acetylmuramoyl-L-alanine amidase
MHKDQAARRRDLDRGSAASTARRRLAAIVAIVALVLIAVRALGGPASGALDPALFAPGACVAYQPTSGDRGKTVFLDAGHGGIDPGGIGVTSSGQAIEEADLTLPVELDAMALLRADGFRVVVSRTADSTVLRLGAGDITDGTLTLQGVHDDVLARDRCANLSGASALVGIYFDASSTPAQGGSLTAYDAARPFAAANTRLARLLQSDVLAALNARGWQIPDDGVLSDSGLGSFDGSPSSDALAARAAAYDHLLLLGPATAGFQSSPSKMPGAVIEPLYITDPFEGALADSVAGQQVIARGIATAVEQFLAGRV